MNDSPTRAPELHTNGQAQPGWMAQVDADLAQQKQRGPKLKVATVRRILRLVDPNRWEEHGPDVSLESHKMYGKALHRYGLPFGLFAEWLQRWRGWGDGSLDKCREFWANGCPSDTDIELPVLLGQAVNEAGWLVTERNRPSRMMSSSTQPKGNVKGFRAFVRKVLAYELPPKASQEPPPPKARHRTVEKKERGPLPLRPELSVPNFYKRNGHPPGG